MPRVEFEPTTPVFEPAKTVHALDRAATEIGLFFLLLPVKSLQTTDPFFRLVLEWHFTASVILPHVLVLYACKNKIFRKAGMP
jgi:hypothetical protein